MTPPKARTYSSARRITRGSCTHFPSSENTRTLARERAIRPSSASSWPPRPLVTAPTGWTSTNPACRPRSRIRSAASAVSVTGEVFAIASTAVKPPSAAALEPVRTVSASSRPGSRRWVCRSTRPGSATRPSASITCAPATSVEPVETTSVMTPSVTTRSADFSPRRLAPLMTSEFLDALMTRSLRRRAGGRARTSGSPLQPRPGRAPRTGRRRRRRRRSPGRGSSGRGGRSGRPA